MRPWDLAHAAVVRCAESLNASVRLEEPPDRGPGLLAFSSDPSGCRLAARVAGVRLPAWEAAIGATAGRRPLALPAAPAEPGAAGAAGAAALEELVLRPFGCTKLRLAVLPLQLEGEGRGCAAAGAGAAVG